MRKPVDPPAGHPSRTSGLLPVPLSAAECADDSAIAKLYATNMANRVVDRVLQIHGGKGYTRELPIARWYRELRLWRIFEGTEEMHRLIISRDLPRGYRKVGAPLG